MDNDFDYEQSCYREFRKAYDHETATRMASFRTALLKLERLHGNIPQDLYEIIKMILEQGVPNG